MLVKQQPKVVVLLAEAAAVVLVTMPLHFVLNVCSVLNTFEKRVLQCATKVKSKKSRFYYRELFCDMV